MRDAKMAILEDQVDTLAGRLADAEERFNRLLNLLTTGQVPKKLGLEPAEIKSRCDVLMVGSRRWHHSDERRIQIAKAELDDFRRRVARAESLSELSGRPFLESFDAARDDDGDADLPSEPVARAESNIWDQALAHLATVVNRYSFTTWLRDTSLIRDDGTAIVVRTADLLAVEWLTKRYSEVVTAALAAVGRPEARVTFVTGDEELPER